MNKSNQIQINLLKIPEGVKAIMKNYLEESFLTVDEVARKLNMSRSYIYKLFRLGMLPFVELGRHRRVDPVDFYKFIEKQKKGIAHD